MRAFILGGNGAVGRAVARRLLDAGWRVDVVGRDRRHLPAKLRDAGARFLAADRDDPVRLHQAFGAGAELLVDCVCFTARHASHLLPLVADAASTVMISSKAVYVDAAGRHSNSPEPPHFDGPIRETQPTLPPGDGDYNSREGYGANKVAAERVLLDSGNPVTVVRPSKIHGEAARPPREWYFVKRVLDRRAAVLLARRGAGIDHPTAAANLAALVEVVAASPGSRILNCADPDAPDGLAISRAVAMHLGHSWEEVLLGDGDDTSLGRYPWDRPHPVVLDMSAAHDLGYLPVGDYAATVAVEVDWLVTEARRAGRVTLPPGFDDGFFDGLFDYAGEDRYLATREQ